MHPEFGPTTYDAIAVVFEEGDGATIRLIVKLDVIASKETIS